MSQDVRIDAAARDRFGKGASRQFRREGKAMYYSLDDDHVRSMIALGMEHTEE